MNSYELLYIIDNDLADESKEAVIAKISAIVTDNGGAIDGVDKTVQRCVKLCIC